MQLKLCVVPQAPLAQDSFQRAVVDDLIDGGIDFGFQRIVAFAKSNVVSASEERFARTLQGRAFADVENFRGHIHNDRIDALQFEIAIRRRRLSIIFERNSFFLKQTRCRRIAERSDDAVLTILKRVNLLFVISDRERELKNVIRLAELNLLLPIGGRLQAVHNDVERLALQCRDERLPIRRNKLGLASHRRCERINHLLLVTDVLIGMIWIVENVRRAAGCVGAPAQRLLGKRATREKQPGAHGADECCCSVWQEKYERNSNRPQINADNTD